MTAREVKSDSFHSGSTTAGGGEKHVRGRANSVPEVVFLNQLRFTEGNRHLQGPSTPTVPLDIHPGHGARRKGKSWKDILKLKRKRAKIQSFNQTSERASAFLILFFTLKKKANLKKYSVFGDRPMPEYNYLHLH